MNSQPYRHSPGLPKHAAALREESRWLFERGATLAEIATRLEVPMRTVQSWKRRSRPRWERPTQIPVGPGGPDLETSPFAEYFEGTSMPAQRVAAWLLLLNPEELRLVQNAVISVREGAANGTVRARQRMIEKLASYPVWAQVRDHSIDVQAAAFTLAEVRGLGPGSWAIVKAVFLTLESTPCTPSGVVSWERAMPGIRQ